MFKSIGSFILLSTMVMIFMIGSASATVTLPEYWEAHGISQYQNSGNVAQNPMVPKLFESGLHSTKAKCDIEVAYQNGLYPDGTKTPINDMNVYRHVDAICHQVYPFQLVEKWYVIGTRQVKSNLVNGENFDIKIGPFDEDSCNAVKDAQEDLTLQGTPFGGTTVGTSLIAKCMVLK